MITDIIETIVGITEMMAAITGRIAGITGRIAVTVETIDREIIMARNESRSAIGYWNQVSHQFGLGPRSINHQYRNRQTRSVTESTTNLTNPTSHTSPTNHIKPINRVTIDTNHLNHPKIPTNRQLAHLITRRMLTKAK